ncbi:hypothetical protein [Sinorhizobium fredii]|uniref:hypothetical protein n=1 Tax=Rhizobium fredii TaxID=380 RepID=UPI0004AD25AE|nr:hypothetical protein [Sinorhizobium fredii]
MMIVIQCAARKRADAGTLKTAGGQDVLFVANPDVAPAGENSLYARPDDDAGDGLSWRRKLLDYNRDGNVNSPNLYRAADLYENPVFEQLTNKYGYDRLHILSAGWGLVSGGFRLPVYDITFSSAAKTKARHKFRSRVDDYKDFVQLPDDPQEPIVFLGGKDYLPLFCKLTSDHRGKRIIFFNSGTAPNAPGCILHRYTTTTRTNWHYGCATELLQGGLEGLLDGIRR